MLTYLSYLSQQGPSTPQRKSAYTIWDQGTCNHWPELGYSQSLHICHCSGPCREFYEAVIAETWDIQVFPMPGRYTYPQCVREVPILPEAEVSGV